MTHEHTYDQAGTESVRDGTWGYCKKCGAPMWQPTGGQPVEDWDSNKRRINFSAMKTTLTCTVVKRRADGSLIYRPVGLRLSAYRFVKPPVGRGRWEYSPGNDA